jgi:cytochrome c biogenesis protein CcdA
MNKKTLGIAALVVGIVFLLVSLGADVLGIGQPGFGTRQITGAIIGAAIAIIGIVFMAARKKST